MKRILIIEDNKEITELERDYLEANDFEVDIAEDGVTGLEKALADEYNLILLDIMLPRMDGFQVCREIRAQKDVPILMVSAKREDIDKIRGLGLSIRASCSAASGFLTGFGGWMRPAIRRRSWFISTASVKR